MIPREVIGDRSQSLLDFTLLDLNARYADVLNLQEVTDWLTTSSLELNKKICFIASMMNWLNDETEFSYMAPVLI